MFKLLKAASQLLGEMDFKWCFCGGWAIDLFLGKESRPHKDLDIMIFREDIHNVVGFLQSKGWTMEAPTRKGFIPVSSEDTASCEYDNLWCMNSAYPLDYLKVDEQNAYNFYHYDRDVQEQVDFIEIQLSSCEDNEFIYTKNQTIHMPIDKVFYKRDGLPFLAPEIVLLYKSKYLSADNQNDFDLATQLMDKEQTDWLVDALVTEYGNDHPWVEILKCTH